MAYDRFKMDRRANHLRRSMEMALKDQPIEMVADTDWHVWPDSFPDALTAIIAAHEAGQGPETH